jgi:hypothetical protein
MANPAGHETAQIRIGQVFRVSSSLNLAPDGPDSYISLTRGSRSTCADIQKGIWAYKSVTEPGNSFKRVPAILLHSNPFKEGSENTPWVDIVEPDEGYAIYNGDNRKSSLRALDPRGNAFLAGIQDLYRSPSKRAYAPPILLFTQREVDGNRKGYREFSGYGVPTQYLLVSHREKKSERYFTNLVIELALFRLDAEHECFDWRWIDLRRDPACNAKMALAAAPAAWKLWARLGDETIERCRRRVAKDRTVSVVTQQDCPDSDRRLLADVSRHFASRPHTFEGLAALVAERVIGSGCKRGWVTRRSADGGVDFVCRLDLGSEFSRLRVVVLGQAKCQRSISGNDLARLVARLQRGWIGVFVTTGVFSRAAQEELYQDQYPVILINGSRLAREVRLLMNEESITLEQLLDREARWYEEHPQTLDAVRILDDSLFGTPLLSLDTISEEAPSD